MVRRDWTSFMPYWKGRGCIIAPRGTPERLSKASVEGIVRKVKRRNSVEKESERGVEAEPRTSMDHDVRAPRQIIQIKKFEIKSIGLI